MGAQVCDAVRLMPDEVYGMFTTGVMEYLAPEMETGSVQRTALDDWPAVFGVGLISHGRVS